MGSFIALLSIAFAAGAAIEIPQPKPDQAVLVVLRPGDPGGGDIVADYVFSNETPLAVTKGKTHSFVDLAAGQQLLWCQGGGGMVDVVPGQTYFLLCGFFHGFSLLDDADGVPVLEKTKRGPALTAEVAAKAKKRLPRFYPAMKKSADDVMAGFPVVDAPVRPADATGFVTVPRYSRVTLELMENVNSANTPTGEKVRFRVVEAEGGAWVQPGTPVEGMAIFSDPSGRGGKAGLLRVDIAGLPAADGTRVPLMGQLIGTGQSRAVAANIGLAVGGFIGMALVKGREAFYLAGERFDFWTRDEAWIRTPSEAPAATAARPADVTARFATPLDAAVLTQKSPAGVQLILDSTRDVTSVALIDAGGWTIPQPVKATSVRRVENSWLAAFDGWSLLRHLKVSETAAPARFEVTFADGTVSIAEAAAAWRK